MLLNLGANASDPPYVRFSSKSKPAPTSADIRAAAIDATANANNVGGRATAVAVAPQRRRRLGDLLVGWGLVNQDQLALALARQQQDGGRLGRVLVEEGVIEEPELLKALAGQFDLEIVDLRRVTPSPDAVSRLDPAIARQLEVLPISLADGTLTVAVSDPLDTRLADELATWPDKPALTMVLASRQDILSGINRAYRALVGVGGHVAAFEAGRRPKSEIESLAVPENAPVIQVVNLVLTQALRDRASDVHIEPLDDRLPVRFRVDGVMQEVVTLPVGMAGALASRLKVMSDMNIVETRRPQDGQFEITIDSRELDVRVATAPTIWGEKVVLRLLDRSKALLDMDQLGMAPGTHERYTELVHRPYGMVLCTGPTGSGKTTTLYATLSDINRSEINVMTIEDPVEYVVPTVNQLHVSAQAGVTFASGLRAILRQDPDVILVGEIRDVETARTAVQSALTGHFVLSSLHATDAASALVRLIDMGVEPFLIAASVAGVVGQRLLRRTCRSCTVPYTPGPDEMAFFTAAGGTRTEGFTKGEGCNFCSGTGYLDRIGVYELLVMDDDIRQLVIDGASPLALRAAAAKGGMTPMGEQGIRLITDGVTTIAEVMRAIYVL